jgi:hypothetical protein
MDGEQPLRRETYARCRMHTFSVVRRRDAWCVEVGGGITAPCRSRAAALAQAERMAEAIRRHGEAVRVISDEKEPDESGVQRSAAHVMAARARTRAIRRRL